jgi:hypothetical protein
MLQNISYFNLHTISEKKVLEPNSYHINCTAQECGCMEQFLTCTCRHSRLMTLFQFVVSIWMHSVFVLCQFNIVWEYKTRHALNFARTLERHGPKLISWCSIDPSTMFRVMSVLDTLQLWWIGSSSSWFNTEWQKNNWTWVDSYDPESKQQSWWWNFWRVKASLWCSAM